MKQENQFSKTKAMETLNVSEKVNATVRDAGYIDITKAVIQEEFDENFYRKHVAINNDQDALTHFLEEGWKTGADPCAWFSVNAYLELNPDLIRSRLNPFFHYLVSGKAEERRIAPSRHKHMSLDQKVIEAAKLIESEFDERYYREKYKIPNDSNPIFHYLEEGWKLGYNPNIWFLTEEYLQINPDISNSGVEPFSHYLKHGITEKRALYRQAKKGNLKNNPNFLEQIELLNNSRIFEVANSLRGLNYISERDWLSWTSKLDLFETTPEYVQCHIENAVIFAQGKEGVILGWVLKEGNPILWAEDDNGHAWFLDKAFQIKRPDVQQAFLKSKFKCGSEDVGFVLRINNVPMVGEIKIKTLSHQGVHIISKRNYENLGNSPVQTAQWLFGINTPVSKLAERFTNLDSPIIESVLIHERDEYQKFNVSLNNYGVAPSNPEISIIIPLYGRLDFIESQLICFSNDKFINSNTEIIYVLDDPRLVNDLSMLSEQLYNLYRIPFKTVWGGINRGFSGANNLGVEFARGQLLLFLNSDVFPKYDGWLELLKNELLNSENYGVVAPRLTFADGSIQHAGIVFKKRTDLNVWINHHPQMGLSPELDENKKAISLPAVTGACMLMRRSDFDSINGWDTGYLIGDFEDSDLCLKLRNIGKECIYVPDVELTHLERQSFQLSGAMDFRMKVVILNAVRHQERWSKLLADTQN